METKKVLKMAIVFVILLNLIIFAFLFINVIYKESSVDVEQNTIDLLEYRGIKLSCSLPTENNSIKNITIGSKKNVLNLKFEPNETELDMDRFIADDLVKKEIQNTELKGKTFQLNSVELAGPNDFILTYIETYNENYILSNTIIAKVDKEGIKSINATVYDYTINSDISINILPATTIINTNIIYDDTSTNEIREIGSGYYIHNESTIFVWVIDMGDLNTMIFDATTGIRVN